MVSGRSATCGRTPSDFLGRCHKRFVLDPRSLGSLEALQDMINRKQQCVREGALASLLENERCQARCATEPVHILCLETVACSAGQRGGACSSSRGSYHDVII